MAKSSSYYARRGLPIPADQNANNGHYYAPPRQSSGSTYSQAQRLNSMVGVGPSASSQASYLNRQTGVSPTQKRVDLNNWQNSPGSNNIEDRRGQTFTGQKTPLTGALFVSGAGPRQTGYEPIFGDPNLASKVSTVRSIGAVSGAPASIAALYGNSARAPASPAKRTVTTVPVQTAAAGRTLYDAQNNPALPVSSGFRPGTWATRAPKQATASVSDLYGGTASDGSYLGYVPEGTAPYALAAIGDATAAPEMPVDSSVPLNAAAYPDVFNANGQPRAAAPARQQRQPLVRPPRPRKVEDNATAADARARGRRSYTSDNGALMPLYSIGGGARNTYGD